MVWGCQQGIIVHCGDGHWTYTPTNTLINTLIMDWGMSEGWAARSFCRVGVQMKTLEKILVEIENTQKTQYRRVGNGCQHGVIV